MIMLHGAIQLIPIMDRRVSNESSEFIDFDAFAWLHTPLSDPINANYLLHCGRQILSPKSNLLTVGDCDLNTLLNLEISQIDKAAML